MSGDRRFTAKNGKEYVYADVLGRTMLCEVIKPKPKKFPSSNEAQPSGSPQLPIRREG